MKLLGLAPCRNSGWYSLIPLMNVLTHSECILGGKSKRKHAAD
jgi:hypothetical protein